MRHITSLLVLIFLFSGCADEYEVKELKLAHGLDTKHPVHIGMEYMAKRLNEKSDGEMTIKIYPSGQLGSERELLELLQIGSLTMTKVSSGVLENFVPSFKILGLPYLFKDKEHLFDVLGGQIGEELLEKGEKFLFRGLCFYDAGYRSFYTVDRPVNEPADLKGLKIRVMKSQTAVDMVDQLGGSPTPVSWGELYTALQQGVVDGAENNPPSFYSSRHYEVCKYYTLDEHTALPDVLLVSLEWWNSFSEQEKTWLKEAALESVEYQKKVWEESEQEALEEVKAAGVEIIIPDKSKFSSQVQPLYDDFKDNPESYNLIQRIKAVGSETQN